MVAPLKLDRRDLGADRAFMQEALALARQAGELGEIPVGAVAVRDGVVIGRGYNRREIDRDPLAHAELIALKQAASSLDAWRLADVVLYVTLEPCAMCAGAMVQGRIERLVYGADDPKMGAAGSLYNLVDEARHNHRPAITRGVLADECSKLMVDFFRELRVKGG
jgi:tRNA(adenine34) deaminase